MITLKNLFESKAFIYAILTAVAAAGGVYGFNVPVATIMMILTPVMIAIGAAGWSDAVKMKAKMALEHEVKMHALNAGMMSHTDVVPGIKVTARTAQAGFARVGVMAMTAAIAGVIMFSTIAITNSGCKKPLPPIVTDIIDCAKTEAVTIANGFSITQLVSAVIGVIAAGPAGAEAMILPLLQKYGGDMVACVLDSLEQPTPAPGAGSGSAAPIKLSITEETRRALLIKAAGNKKIIRAHN